MSDTPETDSLLKADANPWSVFLDMAKLLDLCRKLERERDEARKALHDLMEEYENRFA